MPKAVRSAVEVDAVKHTILETAMSLMCKDGFEALSMRKLANQLGMTAANIYNYYSSKDELYLAIQTKGFQRLAGKFRDISDMPGGIVDVLRAVMRAYIDFGLENPDYYEVMFNRNAPKYSDYVNTPMEPSATLQKQTAVKVADIAVSIIINRQNLQAPMTRERARYITIAAWSTLHGIVNLHASRVLQEVADLPEDFIDILIDDLIGLFFPMKGTNTDMNATERYSRP